MLKHTHTSRLPIHFISQCCLLTLHLLVLLSWLRLQSVHGKYSGIFNQQGVGITLFYLLVFSLGIPRMYFRSKHLPNINTRHYSEIYLETPRKHNSSGFLLTIFSCEEKKVARMSATTILSYTLWEILNSLDRN